MSAIALTLGSLRSQERLVETPGMRKFHMRSPCVIPGHERSE
jgi:hypothetical protein